MKLAFLHRDDYAKAIEGGCMPFRINERVSGDELRVCADDYYAVPKGEFDVWTMPDYEPYGVRLEFVDRIVDDWYDRAPLFPGEVGEEFTFPMPSPYERNGKS